MPFSMQDLMASLPGSPGSQPQVAPTFNPQINTQQLAANVQTNQDAAKSAKNQKLSLMLYALGGALKGDKNFVQNTLALQAMQEGKKKEEERKKRFEELLAKTPEGSLRDLMVTVGSERIDTIAGEIFKSQQPITERPTAAAQNYASLQKIIETGSPEDVTLARTVFAGIKDRKTEEQTLRDTAASLAKTVNPITNQLYTPEEINAQLNNLKNIYRQFSMPKTEDITDDKKVTNVAGFKVEEI